MKPIPEDASGSCLAPIFSPLAVVRVCARAYIFNCLQQWRRTSLLATVAWLLTATLLLKVTVTVAVLQTSHVLLHLQENVSQAKVKLPIVPARFEKAYTYDSLRTFEKYGVQTLTPNKIAVMYNWCQDQDTYYNNSTSHLYLACKVRIEFFSLSGERLQQEFYDTNGRLRAQSSFMFHDPEKFPEMKAIGFWVHGPHEGAVSNKIVLALWTALCPDPGATRECMAGEKGCVISLVKRMATGAPGTGGEVSKETCLSKLLKTHTLHVKSGLRLCDAGEHSTVWPYQDASDCFYYDLSITDADGAGWEKPADGKAHGYRLGAIDTISKDGGRYGSVYLVRFAGGGTSVEWTRKISSHAFLDYGEGVGNAVASGEVILSRTAAGVATTEMQYSVAYHSHYWKQSKQGQVLRRRLCFVQIVRDNGDLVDVASGGLLNTKCIGCSLRHATARVHPQSGRWMSVCNSSSGDGPGIYLNDTLVVDSSVSLKAAGVVSLDPDAVYPIDTHPQLLPTGASDWLLFWKTLTNVPGDAVELFGRHVQAGKLMLAKYDVNTKAFTALPTAITGGLSEPEYRAPYISRFGPKTLLVGFYSALKHTTTLLEIDENGNIVTPTDLVIERTIMGALLNSASASEWQHHTDNTVYWVDRVAQGGGFDEYEALRPGAAYPGFNLQLLRVQGHTTDADCLVEWDSSASCDNSCHITHVLRVTTPNTNCPLPAGSLKVSPCSSGALCEPVRVAAVLEVSVKNLTSLRSADRAATEVFIKGNHLPATGPSPVTSEAALFRTALATKAQNVGQAQGKAATRVVNHLVRVAKKSQSLESTTSRRVKKAATTNTFTSPNVALLFDRDVTTAVHFSNADPSSFAVFLDGGGDIHEFSVAFLLDSKDWNEGMKLSCAAYNRFGKALAVRESFIGRIPPPNLLVPAEVNVSFWQWTNIRLFGVQVVQCTSGSPSLLPSSPAAFASPYSARALSQASSTSSRTISSTYPQAGQPSSTSTVDASALRRNQTISPAVHDHVVSSGSHANRLASEETADAQRRRAFLRVTASASGPPPSPFATQYTFSSPSLQVAELVVLGRPNGGGACPPEGFFSYSQCPSEASRPVFDLASLDCKGEWSQWTLCDGTCMSSRVFRKHKEAAWGGRPCQRIQKRPCSNGPYCFASSFPSGLAEGDDRLLHREQPCSYITGAWSECLHCRQLRFHHILVEAAGANVEACPDPVEMRYCNISCRLQYDFSYTETSTYPPVTTQTNPLPTVSSLPAARSPLSWRRWYVMGDYTIAAFCLLIAFILVFLAACLVCSFKGGWRRQLQQDIVGLTSSNPTASRERVTLASVRRRTAAAVHAAAQSVVDFAEGPAPSAEGRKRGRSGSTAERKADVPVARSCMKTSFREAARRPRQSVKKKVLEVRFRRYFASVAAKSGSIAAQTVKGSGRMESAAAERAGCPAFRIRKATIPTRPHFASKQSKQCRTLPVSCSHKELGRSDLATARSIAAAAKEPSPAPGGFAFDVPVMRVHVDAPADEEEEIDTSSPHRAVSGNVGEHQYSTRACGSAEKDGC